MTGGRLSCWWQEGKMLEEIFQFAHVISPCSTSHVEVEWSSIPKSYHSSIGLSFGGQVFQQRQSLLVFLLFSTQNIFQVRNVNHDYHCIYFFLSRVSSKQRERKKRWNHYTKLYSAVTTEPTSIIVNFSICILQVKDMTKVKAALWFLSLHNFRLRV